MSEETKDELRIEIPIEAPTSEELKQHSIYASFGRMVASVWWGANAELKRVGLDDEAAVDVSMEMTNAILHPLIEHFLSQTNQPSAQDQVTDYLNRFLSNVQFYTPGS